jgi:hypothetical protein
MRKDRQRDRERQRERERETERHNLIVAFRNFANAPKMFQHLRIVCVCVCVCVWRANATNTHLNAIS